MGIPVGLAFHTEKLHDDPVWHRVEAVARWMASRGIGATFFVYPFRALIAERDIGDRVRVLAALGHEIGQHTHFYAGTKDAKHEKADDLSEANIVWCLKRDFETLQRFGCRPSGFTAGGWFANDVVLDTLVTLGFVYDCSARFPRSTGVVNTPYRRWLRKPQQYASAAGDLLRLPTTCSLGEWFKWGRNVRVDGVVPYQLICLHDYDLLSSRFLAPWHILARAKGKCFVPVGMLAKELRKVESHV
ncbi:MAG TPA: hypothetical protein VFL31_02890 [Nitrospiraceae bacterium]|nr:hypothetical protein [Nitrospiraceae bacterium]